MDGDNTRELKSSTPAPIGLLVGSSASLRLLASFDEGDGELEASSLIASRSANFKRV